MRLKPGKKSKRKDQSRDAQREPEEGRARDNADLRLPAARREKPAGQEECDQEAPFGLTGRMRGNRMTSLIDGEFVKSIASRSMPIPSPAVGGIPYESAST